MERQQFAKPFYFFFLVVPYGISAGFVTVTLPYLLAQKGFTVAAIATILSIGISANVWRFLWSPVADLSHSLRTWYVIGVLACTIKLLLLCLVPYNTKQAGLLTVIVFVSQIGASLVVLPLGGLMAHRVVDSAKGRAAGWYQAGSLGGIGLGGGLGLWIATHYNVIWAGVVLGIISLAGSLMIFKIMDVRTDHQTTILYKMKEIRNDLVAMIKIPVVLLVMFLFVTPIGSGGAANLWSAIANDWHVSADTVALVTGLLSGLVSAVGCVAGGYIADRFGKWTAYMVAGALCALAAAIMAILPYVPAVYAYGVLFYAFANGMIYAAFSAMVLHAAGKKAAATKFSLLGAIGNIPVIYMTAFDGWAHDLHGSRYMLAAEALAGIIFIGIVLLMLRWVAGNKFPQNHIA